MADDGSEKRDSYCAADLDDRDPDVCYVSYDDDTTAWYENVGGSDFDHHAVLTAARGGLMSEARDLDDDGDADLLVAAYCRSVLWFENGSTGGVGQRRDPNEGTPVAAPNGVDARASSDAWRSGGNPSPRTVLGAPQCSVTSPPPSRRRAPPLAGASPAAMFTAA